VDGIELEGLEVVLLKDNIKNEAVIKAINSGKYADNSLTKTVHVFAHGNPKEFYNETMKGNSTIKTGADLNNVLNQGSELWKNSDNKEGFTIVLHACRTGKFTTNKDGSSESPVAANISKSNEMEGVTIVAPDERVGFTAGGKEIGPQVTKNADANGDLKPGDKAVQSNKFGHWNSFINGFFFGQQQGNKKPEGKPQYSFDTKLNQ